MTAQQIPCHCMVQPSGPPADPRLGTCRHLSERTPPFGHMARSRSLESSAFVFLLGTLLAHRGGTEAATPFQYHHVSQSRPGVGWAHGRRGAGEAAGAAPELVHCDGDFSTTTAIASSQSAPLHPAGAQIAAALRGGRSMRQMAEEGEIGEDEGRNDLDGDEEQEGEEEEEEVLYDEKAVEWMMQQLCMYQTRIALISNPLAAKGYKLREIVPSPRGLLCAMSTEDRRMDCRMYVEAEVGKKVVAPCKCKGTQKWITFSALNSERRKEAAKWKNCPTCQGPIDYKLYEAYGGGAGKAVSAVLNNPRGTQFAISAIAAVALWVFSPLLHALVVRVMTSGILWKNYHRMNLILHLPLPIQIMGIRFLMMWGNEQVLSLDSAARQFLTDIESQILESRLPVTVAVHEDGEEVAVPYRKL